MTRGTGMAVLLLVVVMMAAACGGGGGQQGGGGGAPASPAGGGQAALAVKETEFKIEPKAMKASPGRVTFTIKNAGQVEHNFIVEGTDIKLESIQPGETKTASATLAAGEYKVVCTIPGHEEAGMVATLKVGQ